MLESSIVFSPSIQAPLAQSGRHRLACRHPPRRLEYRFANAVNHRGHAISAHVSDRCGDSRVVHEVPHDVFGPARRRLRVLVQEVVSSPKLVAIKLRAKHQMHSALCFAALHLQRIHLGIVPLVVEPTPRGAWRAAYQPSRLLCRYPSARLLPVRELGEVPSPAVLVVGIQVEGAQALDLEVWMPQCLGRHPWGRVNL